MKAPSVSVVMPVFNGGPWLQKAIDSIRNQSLRDIELIIIDDGSTDESERIIANAMDDDNRIHMIRQIHSGVAVALNNGIALSGSQFIARMDADDVAHPERLQVQLSFLEDHRQVAALGSWAHVIDEQGHKLGDLRPEIDSTVLHNFLVKQNPFIHSSMMLSTELARQLGGYRTVLEGAEDYDLWLRISEHAPLANLPKFLITHRHHAASASITSNTKQLLAARLARMSAAWRRASKPDIVDQLHAPIDLGELAGHEKFRDTSEFYHMLARSPDDPIEDRPLRCLRRLDLTHGERKAAQLWLKEVLKGNRRYLFRSLALFWLFYLHPPRGLLLAWSMLRAQRFS